MQKELLATDHFQIVLPHALSTNERQLVTLFYQPLIGAKAMTLYLTLWAEGEDTSEGMTHYYLMNVLDLSIRDILEARVALEAIGLLQTWRKDSAEQREFIYELCRPLDPASFFTDPLLSMFLFSKIGEQAYRKLRARFCKPVNKEGFAEVTRVFTDVYKPVNKKMPQDMLEERVTSEGYPFYYEQFDFELLKAGLSEQMVPGSALTVEIREVIAKLAFMYHLTPLDMQKIVLVALDEQLKLTEERLKRVAADYYKLTISKEPPKLARVFEQKEQIPNEAARTREQDLLHYLETTPPIQVLRDINGGKEPVQSSVQMAEQLILTHGMPIGVVNVLLEYVMLTTDMRLPTKYVEKIADHWMRKNLKTAKEAMDLARQERDKYAKWKQENETKPATVKKQNYKKGGRDEQVPDWFYKKNEPVQSKPAAAVDFEAERQKILEKLGQDGQVN